MPITPLPSPPSRSDPANFADEADAFLGALPSFATEANQIAAEINAAANSATTEAIKWVSGTYAEGDVVWSPTDHQTYRKSVAGSSTVDPAVNISGWVRLPSLVNPFVFGAVTEQVQAMPANDINPANGTIQTRTISGATTLTSSLASGQSVLLVLSGGGSHAVTWPSGVKWVSAAGNFSPSLAAIDAVVFFAVGATLYAAHVGASS